MIFTLVKENPQKTRYVCLAAVVFLMLAYTAKPKQNILETVIEGGNLKVAGRLGPLTYYDRNEIPDGLDYNILAEFANSLGVKVEFEIYDDISNQLSALDEDEDIHLAAATLSVTPDRLEKYQFSRAYLEVDTILIQHTKIDRPKTFAEVIEKEREILVISGSAHAELLNELKLEHPALTWREESETIMFQLMEQVQNEELDMAVIDSSIFDLEASLFPNVEVALTLKRHEPIAFAFAQDGDNSLLDALDQFLLKYQASGELDDLLATYLDPEPSIDVASSLLFNRRIEQRLPEYEELFRSVAAEYDQSWVLLAAQAYQESHWSADARSPTGVRGLMMLTLPTAAQLGVESRLDPVQSLDGGIRYLLSLKERIPERIQEPDRTKFALAAYNVGYGHLNDARILTERGGDNPDLWSDVQKYLPLLRQRKYFSTVKYGYARGTEPVLYVNNIYRYANILEWYAWQKDMQDDSIYVGMEPNMEALLDAEIPEGMLKNNDQKAQEERIETANPIDAEHSQTSTL